MEKLHPFWEFVESGLFLVILFPQTIKWLAKTLLM